MDRFSVGLYLKMGCANLSVEFSRCTGRGYNHPTDKVGFGRRVQEETEHRYIGAACHLLANDRRMSVSVLPREIHLF